MNPLNDIHSRRVRNLSKGGEEMGEVGGIFSNGINAKLKIGEATSNSMEIRKCYLLRECHKQ